MGDGAHRGKIKVVTIDDSALVSAVIEKLLSTDYEITVIGHASTAAEAISYLADHPADVVTLDLNLPDASGIQMLDMVISAGHCGVVVVSGSSQEHERALSCGATAAFNKANLFEQRALLLDAIHRAADDAHMLWRGFGRA